MKLFKSQLIVRLVFVSVFLFLMFSTIVPSFYNPFRDSSIKFFAIHTVIYILGLISSFLLAVGVSIFFDRLFFKNKFKFDLELVSASFSFILFIPIVFRFPEEIWRYIVLFISPATNILLSLLFVEWLYKKRSFSKKLAFLCGNIVVFLNHIFFFEFLNRFPIWTGEDASYVNLMLFALIPLAILIIGVFLIKSKKESYHE
jgi:hypothetical protein